MNHGSLEEIKKYMTDERFKHTLGVVKTAVKLAKLYGESPENAEIAALFHDIARDFSDDELIQLSRQYGFTVEEIEVSVPQLLHGKVGAALAKDKYGVKDKNILDAICFHTTGRKKMTKLDKIIFIADMVEPGRDFPGVEKLREVVWQDLNRAVLDGLNSTIKFVLERGLLIHPASIEARNWLISTVC